MKTMKRVALVMGLMAIGATQANAADIQPPTDEIETQIFVMNNYLTDVRVYVEDAKGKLHALGRLARGAIATFSVPESVRDGEFRVKVYPAALPGSRISEDIGVKTNPLVSGRDQQVRLWLESDLPRSIVEIARD